MLTIYVKPQSQNPDPPPPIISSLVFENDSCLTELILSIVVSLKKSCGIYKLAQGDFLVRNNGIRSMTGWSSRNEGSGACSKWNVLCMYILQDWGLFISFYLENYLHSFWKLWKKGKNWRFWEARNQSYYSIFPKCQ